MPAIALCGIVASPSLPENDRDFTAPGPRVFNLFKEAS
jgi:hypothetical protein